ncbi:winged helix-turn-helix domain-containing protein [Myxococcus virescens]|uniref:winged helix-turn-helix domain-containing protein n=1 Tax=Myxococcus virescens TaxID=83456 RepID=UPI003DA24C66
MEAGCSNSARRGTRGRFSHRALDAAACLAHVIQHRYGVRYHPNYLSGPLHSLSFSPQLPPTQARERDDALVRAWLRRDWPSIKRGLVEAGQCLPSWTKRVTRFGPA